MLYYRDCSKGLIDKCGCDLSALKRTDQFNWNGCSDNVRYGIAVSRAFVDAAEKGKNQSVERKIMNLHNNNAGRQVNKTVWLFSYFCQNRYLY